MDDRINLELLVKDFLFVPVYDDATPALPTQASDDDGREAGPLNPALVKAGDTVTLESGTGLVRDVVSLVDHYADGSWRFLTSEPPVQAYRVGPTHWTLTDHQPAPEPEPVWKPGTVADIEVDGGHTYRAIRNDGDQWDAENAWTYGDSEVTDVRPLVVVDPEVARAALADLVVSNADGDPDGWVEAHESTILHAFGIEATS
jgi:hypothetical protein